MNRIGVQLYTLRQLLPEEASRKEAYAALQKMGCHTVQLFGGPDQIRQYAPAFQEYGLFCTGILGGLDGYLPEKKELFALCRKYGMEEIGVSGRFTTLEETMKEIQRMHAFAREAKEEGFLFSYHHHSHELIRTENGKTVLDILMEETDPDLIFFMPDTYWLQHGGCDVRHYLEKMQGRMKTLHLKDMQRTAEGPAFAPVGEGNLFWPGILETALSLGVKDFMIEQDICYEPPLAAVEKSLKYVKALNML